MTQLLISVNSVEEVLIALDAGVNIIDLKNPNVGALGALDLDTSMQILQKVQQYKQLSDDRALPLTSATVGEGHTDLDAVLKAIDARVKIGVDIIKIAVSDLFNHTDGLINVAQLQRVKLIAVFFADESIDLTLLKKLKDSGFYGAMIDTHQKQQNLLEICPLSTLQKFIQACGKNDLKSGLAGSLKPHHIKDMVNINPSYIGFRGGVCASELRVNKIVRYKIDNVKNVLQKHNKTKGSPQVSSCLALLI